MYPLSIHMIISNVIILYLYLSTCILVCLVPEEDVTMSGIRVFPIKKGFISTYYRLRLVLLCLKGHDHLPYNHPYNYPNEQREGVQVGHVTHSIPPKYPQIGTACVEHIKKLERTTLKFDEKTTLIQPGCEPRLC